MAATQLKKTVQKGLLLINLHSIGNYKTGAIKDGCYRRKASNEEFSQFNDHLQMICLKPNTSYPLSHIECLKNELSINDKCEGLASFAEIILRYNKTHNLSSTQPLLKAKNCNKNEFYFS